MARFLAFKQFNSLRPADEGGEAMLRKLKQGELVRVEYSQPRNIQHHRLFWALMSVVHDNLDHDNYPTVEDLASAIKISAGHRTRIQLPNGEVGFIPKSIKFHKMDQDEFSAFYERVCDVIAKHFLPGVTSEQLREEVETMIGIRTSGEARSDDRDKLKLDQIVTARFNGMWSRFRVVEFYATGPGAMLQELDNKFPHRSYIFGTNELTNIKIESTVASGDMGGDTTSEASVLVQGAAVSPSIGAGEPDPQSAPPPANYSALAWGTRSKHHAGFMSKLISETMEDIAAGKIASFQVEAGKDVTIEFGTASGTSAPVAGGDEARADVGPLPPSVGSPSPDLLLLERYWHYLSEFPDKIGVRDATHKFIKQHAVPPEPQLRNKLMRIEQIRLNILSGVYPKAEGEEKAKAAIEFMGACSKGRRDGAR